MSQPSESESPFKRDEPVSRSRKWIILAWGCLFLCAVNHAYWYWRQPYFTVDDLWQSLIWLAVYGALLFFLWRAMRLCGHCRRHRSFDMMATAVRAQRPFWLLLTVAAGIGSIYLVVLAMNKQDSVNIVRKWLKENRPPAATP